MDFPSDLSTIKKEDLPTIKQEEHVEDYVLISTENVITIEPDCDPFSNGINLPEIYNTKIKEEPEEFCIIDCDQNSEYDEDSEKEPIEETREEICSELTKSRKRCAKTTRVQYQKLIKFMQCHPDFGKGKRRESIDQLRFDEEWRCLTEDLNAIGPPIRTSMEWRKVWTDFKANKRRKLATSKTNARVGEGSKRKRNTNWAVTDEHFDILSLLEDADTTNSASSKHFTNSTNEMRQEEIANMDTKDQMYYFHTNMLKKLDVVVEQQFQQNNHLAKLNKNIEKLIEVVKVKYPTD